MRLRLPAAAGLLLALALPSLASAHEITSVDVDCDAASISISGQFFAENGGTTVTVSGPEGYAQSFFADQDPEWTVIIPLGPNGTYVIDWPDSADFGPVEFSADCVAGAVLPDEATNTPTPDPEGAVLPATGDAEPTLPPTDTTTTADAKAGSGFQPVLLLLGAILMSAAVSLGLADPERRRSGR